jgi:hypothetical protein
VNEHAAIKVTVLNLVNHASQLARQGTRGYKLSSRRFRDICSLHAVHQRALRERASPSRFTSRSEHCGGASSMGIQRSKLN